MDDLTTEQRPTPPRRRHNEEVRSREHLTPDEVDRLARAALKASVARHGHRDALMIRMAARHGLRCGEVINLKRDQVHFDIGQLHVLRMKRGIAGNHPLSGWEIRGLRKVLNGQEGSYVFNSERGGPMCEKAFHRIVARAGVIAELPLTVHPHMLRHACGFELANKGVDTRTIQVYLGHRTIECTARYTTLTAERFNGLWND